LRGTQKKKHPIHQSGGFHFASGGEGSLVSEGEGPSKRDYQKLVVQGFRRVLRALTYIEGGYGGGIGGSSLSIEVKRKKGQETAHFTLKRN